MVFIAALFLLVSTNAEASKILFELKGKQYLADIGPGGGVTEDAAIICDERLGCVFPSQIVLGAMDLSVDEKGTHVIVLNETKKANIEAAQAAKDSQAATEKSEFDSLKAKINAETATAVEIRKAFKYLLKKIGD